MPILYIKWSLPWTMTLMTELSEVVLLDSCSNYKDSPQQWHWQKINSLLPLIPQYKTSALAFDTQRNPISTAPDTMALAPQGDLKICWSSFTKPYLYLNYMQIYHLFKRCCMNKIDVKRSNDAVFIVIKIKLMKVSSSLGTIISISASRISCIPHRFWGNIWVSKFS